jgi:N6-adenosine-specific RNA methylase IME4
MKKYNIIYADPPWPNTYIGSGIRSASKKFPLMPMEEILKLKVERLVAKEGVLFLWCPSMFFQEALDTIKAWGFRYKTMGFVWIKMTSKNKPAFGTGHWTRANAEYCLLGVKGKLPVKSHAVSQVILEKRREFARKPDITRDRIITLCGDLPRIELFARQKTQGWDVWGDEVESDIQL